MAFPNYVGLEYGEQHDVSSTNIGNLELGMLGMTRDGNIYRWCKASGTGIAAGLFVVGESVPVHESTVTVAHAVGTETVTVTASGVTADDYAGGYLVVQAGTGAGEIHRIKSNTATSGGTIQITFHAGDGLKVAWSTSDTDVDIFTPLHGSVVIAPVDGRQLVVGLTQGIIPASNYFWALVQGVGPFMVDAAGAATGLELDEKAIKQSLNHAGQGFIDAAPDATKILAGFRQQLGYLLQEEDVVDNEMELGYITLL
tara:strand:- start:71 stop:838 length:768 start_codon:yes stop_codon:yes gene_type:complete